MAHIPFKTHDLMIYTFSAAQAEGIVVDQLKTTRGPNGTLRQMRIEKIWETIEKDNNKIHWVEASEVIDENYKDYKHKYFYSGEWACPLHQCEMHHPYECDCLVE